jgi:hypothetical protein
MDGSVWMGMSGWKCLSGDVWMGDVWMGHVWMGMFGWVCLDMVCPDGKDSFIGLNICCPPGTYEVNVEPSKDNVLFKDEQHILGQFESFLSLVYTRR